MAQYISKKKREHIENKQIQQPTNKKSEIQQNQISISKNHLFWLIAIVLLSFLVYSPTFKNEFTNWDDDQYVFENPFLKDLTGENISKMFFTGTPQELYWMGNYHPLTMLSLSLNYQLSGDDKDGNVKTWSFHLVNILLHLIVTVLIFFIALKLFNNLSIAIISAAFFGVHTLHVESVAWVSERKDVLYSVFFCASILSYIIYIQGKKNKHLIWALVFYLLSLLSKGQAVSLAITIIAIDLYYGRNWKDVKNIIEKFVFIIIGVFFGIIAIKAQNAGQAIQEVTYYEFYKRIGFAGYAFSQYLMKLILPINLSAIYPYPDIINKSFPVHYWLFMFPSIGVSVLFFYYLKRSREIAFSIGFFIINIALLLQLIPVGSAIHADRYAYIPSIGFYFLIAFLYVRFINRSPGLKNIAKVILIIYFCGISVLTFFRIQDWQNSMVLWNDIIKKQPEAVVALNNRGSLWAKFAIKERENRDMDKFLNFEQKAIDDYTAAIKLKPDYYHAMYNRGTEKMNIGVVYNDTSYLNSAVRDFDLALTINLNFVEAFHNRGIAYDHLGKYQMAISDFDHALKLKPQEISVLVNRGVTKGKLKNYTEAIIDFNKALEIKPADPTIYCNRGLARDMMMDYKGAIDDYNKAIELDSNFFTAYFNRGLIRRRLKDYQSAISDFSKAIEVEPYKHDAYYFRALTMDEFGKRDEACKDLQRAYELKSPYALSEIKRLCN